MTTFKDRCRAVNERSDIVSVAMHLGLEVQTSAGVPFAHCPFHGDTGRRNLAFYQEPGERGAHMPRAYCFSCKTQATALDLIMQLRHYDIFEALEWLQRFLGIVPGEAPAGPVRKIIKPAPLPVKDKRGAVDAAIRRLHHDKRNPALAYLRERGISDDIIEAYQLGDWGIDASRWSGRFIIPYLESLERDSSVWTMVGGRVRPAAHMGELLGKPGAVPLHSGHPASQPVNGDDAQDLQGGHARTREDRADGEVHLCVDRDGPKYLYTKGASRRPYLWDIALDGAQRDGYLIICEGELDGLSLLSALGVASPVTAMGGVGAIGAVADDTRLAGLDITYIADREAPPRYGTEHEEKDMLKVERLEKATAQAVWKLSQLNANVRLVYPPDINTGKTDVNDVLMSYGAEGLLDWVLSELNSSASEGRSLI